MQPLTLVCASYWVYSLICTMAMLYPSWIFINVFFNSMKNSQIYPSWIFINEFCNNIKNCGRKCESGGDVCGGRKGSGRRNQEQLPNSKQAYNSVNDDSNSSSDLPLSAAIQSPTAATIRSAIHLSQQRSDLLWQDCSTIHVIYHERIVSAKMLQRRALIPTWK